MNKCPRCGAEDGPHTCIKKLQETPPEPTKEESPFIVEEKEQ